MPGKHNAGGCGCCEQCEHCPGETPLHINAYINNVVDDTCTDCEEYNSLEIALTRDNATYCQWNGETDAICTNTDYWTLELLLIDGDYVVRMTRNCGDSEIYWEAIVDPLEDCCIDLNGLELEYTGETINDCAWTNSIVTLSVDCAGDVECSYCGQGAQYTPDFVSVAISGNFTGAACPQATCDQLESTYVCQYDGGSTCTWTSARYSIPCGAGGIEVVVKAAITSTTLSVSVLIYAIGGSVTIAVYSFSKSYTSGGCSSWSSESVPYTSTTGLSAPCDITTGSATITAL